MSALPNDLLDHKDSSVTTALQQQQQQQNNPTNLVQTNGTTTTTCDALMERSSSTATTVTASQEQSRQEEPNEASQTKKREVYRFQTDWLISSVAWANTQCGSFHLALSSFIENYQNHIQLVTLVQDAFGEEIQATGSFEHPYPATKVLWIPNADEFRRAKGPQFLATTADYLRLWRVEQTNAACNSALDSPDQVCDTTLPEHQVKLECLLNPNKGSKHCAPLTSFDWNDIDPSLIVTASVDTTCAIWDIEVGKLVQQQVQSNGTSNGNCKSPCNLRNQIVTHDHEVYDVSFSRAGTGRDMFVSCSGDGSVRLFDLRRLSTSSMLYETDGSNSSALLHNRQLVRVSCNKKDSNYVSFFARDSNNVILVDIRSPGRIMSMLNKHAAPLNSMSWAPHSAHHICTAGEDNQALIWEVSPIPNATNEPLLAYRANGKINSITWSASHTDWIAIGFQNYLELLRV